MTLDFPPNLQFLLPTGYGPCGLNLPQLSLIHVLLPYQATLRLTSNFVLFLSKAPLLATIDFPLMPLLPMLEAPNLPVGTQGQGNDPGLAVLHNIHAPATLNALALLNIPPAVNAPP